MKNIYLILLFMTNFSVWSQIQEDTLRMIEQKYDE